MRVDCCESWPHSQARVSDLRMRLGVSLSVFLYITLQYTAICL